MINITLELILFSLMSLFLIETHALEISTALTSIGEAKVSLLAEATLGV